MRYLTLAGYRWLTVLLCPIMLLWDCWRAFKQPIYRPYRSQRWAMQLPEPINKKIIWIHAVSVGETQACAPLLRSLLMAYPKHAVLLTHMTPTGRDTGAALFANQITQGRVQQCYLPYDILGLPQRFLNHFKPSAGMVMETEIWPNTVAACQGKGIPLGLANARMSAKTLRGSLRFKRLAQQTFNCFAWVAAQSEQDAQRLSQLCSKAITVTGNLKFEVSPDVAQMTQGTAFKIAQNTLGRSVIALASTREGEEALLLTQLKPWLSRLAQPPLLLLIPRHPKRAGELVGLLGAQGLRFCQRSKCETPTLETQVYLCDTLGEMWFYFGASNIAVVGGGWLPHGGQNLIEPCMAGCAVVVGPHMFNFTHATQQAVLANAVIQCASAQALSATLDGLMILEQRQTLLAQGTVFSHAHAGATGAHMALIEQGLHMDRTHLQTMQ
jgi:3-deoxy-D-manno-octulosonic-acid transferase